MNNRGVPIEGCFSPDSKYVISGSSDGRVHAWNADTGYKVIYIIYRVTSHLVEIVTF